MAALIAVIWLNAALIVGNVCFVNDQPTVYAFKSTLRHLQIPYFHTIHPLRIYLDPSWFTMTCSRLVSFGPA